VDGRFYNVSAPSLTPFLISRSLSNRTRAAVVVAPGGAYRELSWDLEGTQIANWLNSIGISAFVLKYRVPLRGWLPFGRAQLIDAQRAMRLVRSRAAELGLNASRVGFIGFSAGAHLSAHVANAFNESTYARIDAADDLSCRPDVSLVIYPWCVVGDTAHHSQSCGADTNHTLSLSISAAVPPTIVVQAEDDPVHVYNSIYYYLGLKQAPTPPSELHIYPRGGHGYGLCPGRKPGDADYYEVCTWPARARAFLETLSMASMTCTASS